VAALHLLESNDFAFTELFLGTHLLPFQFVRMQFFELIQHTLHAFVRFQNFANSEASISGVKLGQLGQYPIALFI